MIYYFWIRLCYLKVQERVKVVRKAKQQMKIWNHSITFNETLKRQLGNMDLVTHSQATQPLVEAGPSKLLLSSQRRR